MKQLKIALFGFGTIGRELVSRTLTDPSYEYVAVGDTSGVLVEEEGFSVDDMSNLVEWKEGKKCLGEFVGHDHYESMSDVFGSCNIDILVDVTDTQTYDVLKEALDYAHVVTSNKLPVADVSCARFRRLVSKAKEERRVLDFGTTAGAGMRIPDIIESIGCNGVELIKGCLSGTMNYVSQRINEEAPLSEAIKEAMAPPRCYSEPDPRVDLAGEDFARKLVILGRLCGRSVELRMVKVADVLPDDLRHVQVEEFLARLGGLDQSFKKRIWAAKKERKAMWYLGKADLKRGEYTVGFEEIPFGDPMIRARESDNVLRIYPSLWRRPITIMGPGAGPPETATGLIHGLSTVSEQISTGLEE